MIAAVVALAALALVQAAALIAAGWSMRGDLRELAQLSINLAVRTGERDSALAANKINAGVLAATEGALANEQTKDIAAAQDTADGGSLDDVGVAFRRELQDPFGESLTGGANVAIENEVPKKAGRS